MGPSAQIKNLRFHRFSFPILLLTKEWKTWVFFLFFLLSSFLPSFNFHPNNHTFNLVHLHLQGSILVLCTTGSAYMHVKILWLFPFHTRYIKLERPINHQYLFHTYKKTSRPKGKQISTKIMAKYSNSSDFFIWKQPSKRHRKTMYFS